MAVLINTKKCTSAQICTAFESYLAIFGQIARKRCANVGRWTPDTSTRHYYSTYCVGHCSLYPRVALAILLGYLWIRRFVLAMPVWNRKRIGLMTIRQHPIRDKLIVRFETTSTLKVRLIIPLFNYKLLVLSKFETTTCSKLLVNKKEKLIVVRN